MPDGSAIAAPASLREIRLSDLLREAMSDEIAIACPKFEAAREIARLLEDALDAAMPFVYMTEADPFRDALERLGGERARLVSEFMAQEDTLEREREEWWAEERERQRIDRKMLEQLRPAVFERDGSRCRHCGSTESLCLDHVRPRCKGGETTYENLQVLCRPCNLRKGRK